jgi:hypothetical protein
MNDQRPDYSLKNANGRRETEKPELFLVRHFQIKEADYMKPPLSEQLLEPDGQPSTGTVAIAACTCNIVCTCVPVSVCTCNTICTCNTVNTSYGISSGGGGGGRGSRGGGHGGYWAPCF